MTPAEIAATLTKAQREALLGAAWLEMRSAYNPAGYYCGARDRRTRYCLKRAGLLRDYLSMFQPLTPLGLAVRALLMEAGDGE